MHKIFSGIVLLGALTFGSMLQAQQAAESFRLSSTDLAVTYTTARARTTPSDGRFWMQGGSADFAANFFHGLGVAANLTGEHASNIGPGVDLSKVSFMAGPRYTYSTSRCSSRFLGTKHAPRIFGEALFGTVHAFNGTFPASAGGTKSSTSAFSMQLGGGVDVPIARGLGVRLLEVDYVRSSLPNLGDNTQNDLRLAFGVSYRIGK